MSKKCRQCGKKVLGTSNIHCSRACAKISWGEGAGGERKRAIEKYVSEGMSMADIGRKLGISRARVHQIFREYHSLQGYRRDKILKRDNYKCALCLMCDGATENLNVHHIDGDTQNNAEDNLVTCCLPCHLEADKKMRETTQRKRYVAESRKRKMGEFVCLRCHATVRIGKAVAGKRRYCSRACFIASIKLTPEQKRQLNAQRARAWNARHRNDPDYRLKVAQRNYKQSHGTLEGFEESRKRQEFLRSLTPEERALRQKERANAYVKRRYAADPEYRARMLERSRRQYLARKNKLVKEI